MVALDLAERCADQKGTLFVYIWLWHYAGKDDAAWPSIDRLALECHMSPRDVRKALKWLHQSGWITRQERPGFTSIYHVRSENPSPKRTRGAKGNPLPKRTRGPLPQTNQGTPPPNGTPNNKQEQKPRTRTPLEGANDAGTSQTNSPQPAADTDPIRKPEREAKPAKTKPAKLTITAADVEHSLPPGSAENYVRWWNEARRGKRTERALETELKQIRLIENDPAGGSAAAAEQIRKALETADLGCQAWQAITHANWQRYGGAQSAARAMRHKPNPWENEHGHSLLQQAFVEGLI